jgi:Sulfotransferase family
MVWTRDVIRTKLRFWITESQVTEWAERTNLFFILAIGRSGTAFLADLLNQVPGAAVYHEPVKADFQAYPQAFHDPQKALKYIHSFRSKEIYLRAGEANLTTYGEVNSLLRRHSQALKEFFPKATFLHLIRDGRHVVRSMAARTALTPGDEKTLDIYPTAADPWHNEWSKMDRFARLCWYWQVENAYLRKTIAKTVHFEKIITDYNYFKANVLEPCHLELPMDLWKKSVSKPKNVTTKHKMASWTDWDASQKATFDRICGQEMTISGFEM